MIERFGHLVRNRLERIERVVQALNSAFFQNLLGVGDRGFDFAGHRADLFAVLIQRLLHLIDKTVQTIARFDFVALGCVFR